MAEVKIPKSDDREHLDSIVSKDEVKVRKPSVEHRLRNVFISENADSVGDYLVWQVIVPAIKGMLQDAGHGIVDTVFGRGNGSYRSSGGYRGGYSERRSYEGSSSYRNSYGSSDYYNYRNARSNRDYSYSDSRCTEIEFRSRAKAEEVRDTLQEIVDREGCAAIIHLNDLIGVNDVRDDDEWGWYNVSRMRIRSMRNGYILELPKPEFIEGEDRWWMRRR